MPGEAMHQKGAEGAQRAKRWLDSTTRTKATWTNADAVSAGRLEYVWPHAGGNPFSFDVGGLLFGSPFDGHSFMAEVKNYSGDDLGPQYDEFLAKCYLVFKNHRQWADQFMFLTWHPFRIKKWTKLCDAEAIVAGCLAHRRRLFDETDEAAAKALIDMSVVDDLAGRLWLVVLSEKQEELLMSNEDRALVVGARIKNGLL